MHQVNISRVRARVRFRIIAIAQDHDAQDRFFLLGLLHRRFSALVSTLLVTLSMILTVVLINVLVVLVDVLVDALVVLIGVAIAAFILARFLSPTLPNGGSMTFDLTLVPFASRVAAIEAASGISLALLGFLQPIGLPLLQKRARHLQGVPEARVAAVVEAVHLGRRKGRKL